MIKAWHEQQTLEEELAPYIEYLINCLRDFVSFVPFFYIYILLD